MTMNSILAPEDLLHSGFQHMRGNSVLGRELEISALMAFALGKPDEAKDLITVLEDPECVDGMAGIVLIQILTVIVTILRLLQISHPELLKFNQLVTHSASLISLCCDSTGSESEATSADHCSGALCVCGPSGSGKSAVLAAFASHAQQVSLGIVICSSLACHLLAW